MLPAVFCLVLRQTEGPFGSIIDPLGLDLAVPDPTARLCGRPGFSNELPIPAASWRGLRQASLFRDEALHRLIRQGLAVQADDLEERIADRDTRQTCVRTIPGTVRAAC
jgi:hypothetical protein